MRIFPVAFAISLFALAALLLVFVYYAVESIWGYDEDDPRWGYAFVALGELALAAWFGFSGYRILRRR